MKAIALSKRKLLDPDSKALHQINFSGNLNQRRAATMFSLLKKQRKPF